MSTHLIELPLTLRSLHLWAGARKLGAAFDEGAALHHLLGETFGPSVLQPFRLMVASGAKTGTLYAYAASDAESLRARALSCMTPSLADVIALDRLRSLPRPISGWMNGKRLGFDLRLRPVVRLASSLTGLDESGVEVAFRKGAEVDAFLAEALRDRQTTREKVYLDWLSARLASAATLESSSTRLVSFQRTTIMRDGRRLEGPDAVVHGTLTITDPSAFANMLSKGIGRHRSYGYGMILVRPPQRQNQC